MSLRIQINVILAIFVATFVVSSLVFFKNKQDEVILMNMKSQAAAVTNLVAEDLAKMVFLDDPDVATDITRRIQKVDGIVTAKFSDSANKPFLTIHPQRENTTSHSHVFHIPIEYQGVQVGYAHVALDSYEWEQKTEQLTQFALYLTLSLVIAIFMFTYYFDKRFTSRLSALSKAIRTTTENNNFNVKLETKGQDEISQTITNFNQLVNMMKVKTDALNFQARHDVLTGLYNRQMLLQRIEESQSSPKNHTLCYIDLDHFKVVNDTAGHITGDRLLNDLSKKMLALCSEYQNSTLGRIGGDEFILLLEDTSPQEAKMLVNKLLRLIRDYRFSFEERTFRIGASIGMIDYTHQQVKDIASEELLSAADMACHRAKNEGRNKIADYNIDDINLASNYQDMSMVQHIHTGLDHNLFELYLQPIVSLKAPGAVRRYETLLRLYSPNREFLLPGQFIQVAEQFGLSKKIDLWVITEVMKKLDKHPEFLESIDTININLSSGLLMESNCAEEISFLFERYQLPYEKITFEITETAPLANLDAANEFMAYFQNKGSHFALDDFGTGMASFNYLSRLSVNSLKIDGSFVKKMTQDVVMLEMVKAMNHIGTITNTKVVAEKVEDQATFDHLKDIGVDYVQGYFIAKPAPFDDFIK